ncbi:MAG: molybdopterin synthase catalytic subunit MoaE [Pseudogulbenkiania sp.]|nr:molybdopterin synthase catalytic subunit MoaE [Pseudogulbenkiania sp.]
MDTFTVRVDAAAFDAGQEIARLSADPGVGAVVSFVGVVRRHGDGDDIAALELEHYPGMTEKSLAAIVAEARQRWPLSAVLIHHRVGRLALGEPIVLVVTTSAHRAAAFAACEFLMDYLKTRAPFWKKEIGDDGRSHWVEAKASDEGAAGRWQ